MVRKIRYLLISKMRASLCISAIGYYYSLLIYYMQLVRIRIKTVLVPPTTRNLTHDRDACKQHGTEILLRPTILRESKKGATLTMAITLSILGGFAKFFHCWKGQ